MKPSDEYKVCSLEEAEAFARKREMNAYKKDFENAIEMIDWQNTMLKQQADRIAELEKFNKAILKKGGCDGNICKRYDTHPHKELSDEEIYELWCEADNTELLPEMRLKDGSINYIITTFARLIEERHMIK